MEKGITVADIENAAAAAHARGIAVGFFLQFGYPGETREDVEATRALLRECDPDDIGISVAYPLPGTRFFDRVRHELGRKQNWDDSADLAMMYEGPFPTGFYRALHGLVHAEFRARRAERRTTLRGLAARIRHRAAAPWHRLRLEWWARRPHRSVSLGGSVLSPDAARRPTPEEA
jgi:anaerobic magnesium-protoporphyrin IX monomethyl ester cyclase